MTMELEIACVLQSMFLMTRKSVVRRWMQDGMLESTVSDVQLLVDTGREMDVELWFGISMLLVAARKLCRRGG